MYHLHIGGEAEYIKFQVPASLGSDGWAEIDVEVAVRGFTGSVRAYFDKVDFSIFGEQLADLYRTLDGRAELAPLDKQVVLSLVGNGRGGIDVRGEAWSQATYENKLEFIFAIDQTFLPNVISQLDCLNGSPPNENV